MSKGKFLIPIFVILLLVALGMLWINFRIGSSPKLPSVPLPFSGDSREREIAPSSERGGAAPSASAPSTTTDETAPATGTSIDSRELDDLEKSADELKKFLESQRSEKDLDDSGVGIK